MAKPHEVIMPALGMAQETGILVRWLVEPGAAVTKGSPLIEVETDKAVQEVEAQADGFLSDLRAGAGDEVPVGEVIGLIVAAAGDVTEGSGAAEAVPEVGPEEEAEAKAASNAAAPDAQEETPVSGQSDANIKSAHNDAIHPLAPSGRILASPKLRRMADDAGLDLALLVAHGHPQPYHAADLDLLRQLTQAAAEDLAAGPSSGPSSGPATSPAAGATSGPALGHISARVPAAPCDGFLARMREDAGLDLAPMALWASFAASALRAATAPESPLVVTAAVLGPEGFAPTTALSNPDLARLSVQPEAPEGASPSLILRDLTASALTGLRPAGGLAAPALTLARDRNGGSNSDSGSLLVALDYSADQLDEDAALALITGLAARLADPLTYLV